MCLGYRLCPCRLKLMLRLLVTGKGGLYRGCYFLPWWAPRERVFIINMSSFKQQVGFLDVKHERACLLLLETTRLFSKVAIPFCIPTDNERQFLFLLFLDSIWWVHLPDFGHLIDIYGIDTEQRSWCSPINSNWLEARKEIQTRLYWGSWSSSREQMQTSSCLLPEERGELVPHMWWG